MNYEKINELYSKIANNINAMIPIKWYKVLYYFEVSGCILYYAYFYENGKNEPIQLFTIRDKYDIDSNKFLKLRNEITNCAKILNNEFAKANQERWTTLTFTLWSDGKFNVDYGYENLSDTSLMERREIWENKYLNT